MGFGAVIASGEENRLLPNDLLECLTEVRVEQSLDQPTRFAIRFQEDYDETGEPRMAGAPELAPEQMITIAVKADEELKCLVRGPITEIKCSFAHGGPGSWVEVHGIDRRVEMGRVCQRKAWIGTASSAAQLILAGYGFIPNVQPTTRIYVELTSTLNQRGTDQDFLRRIARQNNLSFWISYLCEAIPFGPLIVVETANLTSSPPRPEGPPIPAPPAIPLIPNTDVRLRVNPPPEQCQTVTSFDLHVQTERPSSFDGQAVNDRMGRLDRTNAQDTQPPVVNGGEGLRGIAPAERTLCLATGGDQIELQERTQAALTEAGWLLNATARTTAHMLGGVLVPHDIVEVENVGSRHSGPYQVSQVAHTINAADHHMEIQLRRNAIGKANGSPFP